jgi:hypothetical protein
MVETVCRKLTIVETIKFVILAIIIYALVSEGWDLMNTWIKETLGLKETTWDKFKIFLVFLFITIVFFVVLRVDPINILGVNTHCLNLE